MSDALILAVQTALKAAGFDPGPLDGDSGPLTRSAIAAYQKSKNLSIQYPGTLGAITLASLLPAAAVPGKLPLVITRPWFDLAVTKKGLLEGQKATAAFLRSDGETVGDPSKLPWCGDFVQTCLALSLPHEPLPANPYLARNWLKFGVECEPQQGAVLVFWRGSKTGTQGHVTFDAGAGKGVLYCLGGNQKNRVSVEPIAEARLLGARWPRTLPLPATVYQPTMVGGNLSLNEA
jgi:uncharacterized protein (TIGR02594 family)